MAKEDIVLRETVYAPLTTLGAEMTAAQFDSNWIEIYDQLVALSQSSFVDAYNAGKTYNTDDPVMYSNQLYKALQDGITGVTPGTDAAKWSAIYATDLIQKPNGIITVKKVIESADVKTLNSVQSEIIPALGANKIADIIEATVSVLFDTGSPSGTPYATSTTLYLAPTTTDVAGGETPTFTFDQVLASQTIKTVQGTKNAIAFDATKDFVPPNTAYNLFSLADPTAGDSDIIVTCTYRIIDLTV